MSNVILDRKIFQNPVVNNPEEFYAWVWLLAHADNRGRVQFSYGGLAAEWFWTRSRVQRFLARLESENMAHTDATDRESVLTLTNWAKYQKPLLDDTPKPKARNAPTQRATQFKEPTEKFFEWVDEQEIDKKLDVHLELEKFEDHHRAKGNTFRDWDAAARNWMRNAIKYQERDSGRISTKHRAGESRSDSNRDKLRNLLQDD